MAQPLPTEDPEPTPAAPVIPFADASPAELREAILPEDVERFDASLQRATDAVVETLSLDPVWEFLEHWRRIARVVNHNGHDHWRGVMARADYINQHGHPPPGTKTYSADESRAMVQRRLAGLGHPAS
ncbi:MAG: DUF6247 family protein [Pseudonocardiaceae bacterium]